MSDYQKKAEEKLRRLFVMTYDHAVKWLAKVMEKADKWDQIEPMMPEITRIILDAEKVVRLLGLVTKPREVNFNE